MTFSELWNEYHTPISLLLGVIITVSVFRIPKVGIPLKILVILILMFLLTGLLGLLKYLGLVLAIAVILYGAFVSVFGIGIIVLVYLDKTNGWNLSWWQIFLICGVWGIVAQFVNLAIMYIMVFVFHLLGVASDKLPTRIKRRLGMTDEAVEDAHI